MKISIKYTEIGYASNLTTAYADESLVEAWSNSTNVSRIVEGPRYYSNIDFDK